SVMFCDLVGSTAIAGRVDPEDMREVIGAYHRTVASVVAGFDGFVAKYMGDGVLIYFGYPGAHEDDAERAVRAGLGLVDAIAGLAGAAPKRRRQPLRGTARRDADAAGGPRRGDRPIAAPLGAGQIRRRPGRPDRRRSRPRQVAHRRRAVGAPARRAAPALALF